MRRNQHGRCQHAHPAAEVITRTPSEVPPRMYLATGMAGVLALDHTVHQGRQIILHGGGFRDQYQRLSLFPKFRGHPPTAAAERSSVPLPALSPFPSCQCNPHHRLAGRVEVGAKCADCKGPTLRQDRGHYIQTAEQG